jgi:hypothetical protein
MALYYQTEYRLGRRGRVSRSYTGIRAFVAIVTDLTFGLCFELVSGLIVLALRIIALALGLVAQVLRVNWKIIVVVMSTVVYVLTIPFVLLHRVVARVEWDARYRQEHSAGAAPILKPDWGLGQEV